MERIYYSSLICSLSQDLGTPAAKILTLETCQRFQRMNAIIQTPSTQGLKFS